MVPVNPHCPHLCCPSCSGSNFPEFKGRKRYKETVAFEQWNSANNVTTQLQGMTQCCQHCPGWGNRLQASTCHSYNVTHANPVTHLQRGGGPGPSAHPILWLWVVKFRVVFVIALILYFSVVSNFLYGPKPKDKKGKKIAWEGTELYSRGSRQVRIRSQLLQPHSP